MPVVELEGVPVREDEALSEQEGALVDVADDVGEDVEERVIEGELLGVTALLDVPVMLEVVVALLELQGVVV